MQIFRNIPLILQLVFWYAVLIYMPGPRQAMSFMDIAFLSKRGLMLPTLNIFFGVLLGVLVFAALLPLLLRRATALARKGRIKTWLAAVPAALVPAAFATRPEAAPLFDTPQLKGLRFAGGVTVSTELVAMIIAIVLYGSAYIAEVVRGGLEEVPLGLTEAGKALGLGQKHIWFRI